MTDNESTSTDITPVDDAEKIKDAGKTKEKPVEKPTGIHHVIVNGKVAVEDEEITGERGGTVLRREN